MDGAVGTGDTPSFLRHKEESFQKDYGIDNEVANKWVKKLGEIKSTPRRAFDSSNDSENDDLYRKNNCAMSDTDLMTKDFKRNNLINMFLKGTEVDKYIINNMYGRKNMKDTSVTNDDTFGDIGEMTMLENFNPDETFTN